MPKLYGTPTGYEPPSSSEGRQKPAPPSESYIRQELARAARARAAREEAEKSRPAKPPKAAQNGPSRSDPDNPTRDLRVTTAAKRIMGRKAQIDKAVEDAS